MLPMQNEKITARGVRGLILAALDTGNNSWINDVAMRMSSDQAIETYAWLGNSPAMREFIAGRQPAELKENSFTITNKDYETSLNIKLKDLRRDKLGMVQMRVNQLADRAMDHPAKLLSNLIIAGESTVCYDGQFFFDTDHLDGDSGTLSNDITATAVAPTNPTADEMSEAILKGVQQMYGFKDDKGEPINQSARQFTVMIPTTFMGNTLKAVTAMLGTGGASATLPSLSRYFDLRIVPNARLNSWTTKFAILRTDEAAKPFILQEEGPMDVLALGEGSEHTQKTKECLFGVDWSGNVGYAWWQHACLVTLQ